LVRRVEEFVETHVGRETDVRTSGQVLYPAVAIGERAGKALRDCVTVLVRLTVMHPSDAEVLHQSGSVALRRTRLARLCAEAYRQGAALSHEDLSLLLAVDLSTVRRQVASCAEEGERPVTRGLVEDIGPTVSHKELVLHLYFRGLLPARIAARTGHSLGSVERYLLDFARVVALRHRELEPESIVRITGLSPRVVRSYLGLLEHYDQAVHRPIIERLMRRFGPIDEPTAEEVDHG
jgi:hypothetical protein